MAVLECADLNWIFNLSIVPTAGVRADYNLVQTEAVAALLPTFRVHTAEFHTLVTAV